MTYVMHHFQELLDTLSFRLSLVASWFGFRARNNLHTDRFATKQEVKNLLQHSSYGLVLGLDTLDRLLCVEATAARPHLGHLAIFGPTGAGKTTREEEQLRRWKGSAIINDPK